MAENAAPNRTLLQEARIYPSTTNRVSGGVAAAGVVRKALISIYEFHNNAPYINDQTYWANRAVRRKPQGF